MGWRKRAASAVALIAGLALAQIVAAAVLRGMQRDGHLLQVLGVRYVGRLVVAYYDVLVIVAVAAAFAGLALLASPVRRAAGVVTGAYVAVSVAGLWLQLANVRADELLGGPLTFQWLYYADFLRSFTSQNAMASTARPDYFALYFMVPVAAVVGALVFRAVALRLVRGVVPTAALSVALAGGFAAYALTVPAMLPASLDGKLVNPLYVVARTGLVDGAANLYAVDTRIGPEDFRGDPALSAPRVPGFEAIDPASIRNVVLIVQESVGAFYVHRPIGDRFAMPLLLKRAERGVSVSDVYATAPLTQKTLFGLVAGQYPRLTYRHETDAFAGMDFETLPHALKRAGFATGLFISADFRYQNGDEFLAGRGFDAMADVNTVECAQRTAEVDNPEWKMLRSVRDRCTFATMERWIESVGGGRFFGMLWTDNTHYDYDEFAGHEPFAVDDPTLAAYGNALIDADRDLDAFFGFLHARGLDDETLVIVIGDHGEGFGQHGNRVHGESIHEEEVRIPFLMFHPALPPGRRLDAIGSVVDIPPTVLDLLGEAVPASWQGRSLIRGGRTGRAYLFVPSRDFIVGYREGPFKYMLNLAQDRFGMYDLRSDPDETRDLAPAHPEMKAAVLERLAAWAQNQEAVIAGYAPRPPAPAR